MHFAQTIVRTLFSVFWSLKQRTCIDLWGTHNRKPQILYLLFLPCCLPQRHFSMPSNSTAVLSLLRWGKGGELLRNLTLPLDLIKKMVEWGRAHRDVASILFVEGDNHYVMDRSEEYALFMHKHLLESWPILIEEFCVGFFSDVFVQILKLRIPIPWRWRVVIAATIHLYQHKWTWCESFVIRTRWTSWSHR